MVAEITIIVKDEEKRLTKKFLEYNKFRCDVEDDILDRYIQETVKEFGASSDKLSVKVRINIEVQ